MPNANGPFISPVAASSFSGRTDSPQTDALNARYVAGELSDREHTVAVIAHARTLPKGEPVQEYFTSLEDGIKANPGR